MRCFRRTWLAVLCGMVLTSAYTARSEAQDFDPLQETMSMLAYQIKSVLGELRADSVAVGQYTGPPAFATAAGSGIRTMLSQELQRLGVRTAKFGAPVGLQGKFKIATVQNFDRQMQACIIETTFVDGNGNVLARLDGDRKASRTYGTGANQYTLDEEFSLRRGMLETTILDGAAVALLMGATVVLPPINKPDDKWDNFIKPESVVDSFRQPTAELVNRNTAVRASRNSPFLVEILVNDRPREMTLEQGQPVIQLAKGEEFRVRVTNNAPFTSACMLTLDGVSNFAFSQVLATEGERKGLHKYTRWILTRGRPFTIDGWHINNQQVQAFKVTDFEDSASAKVGNSSQVGTITVRFMATWIQGREQPPPDEPIAAAMAPDAGIGRGRDRTQRVEEDRLERGYGKVRAVVTIRYEKPEAS